ncbi:MAG: fibronectin type III domain-containing protein [Nitrosopumilus sp.]|uniref:fibronectin type III domain-containing protein n=1 Tax=Nitrosopumilus sp. TaxID=2024843 RepID=UPI00247CB223|nr:fibronectin type III domain-containing protein [Nitrosopumilus sp.]MCV0392560.1 fibronectin type III domain-containing protein [Nitrosopumilus sp.]
MRYVYKNDAVGSNTPSLTVTLKQGPMSIASWTHSSIPTSFVLTTQTLSSIQSDSITNYSDLRISFNAQCDALCGNSPSAKNSISVSWTEFSVGDAPISVPAQVTGLSAVAVSPSQINLSWTAPNDGGSAITGYKIERESPIGSGWSILVSNTGNTNTNYSDSGLNHSTTYQYRVSAINAIGTGSPSDAVSATTQSMTSTIPAQVTGLSAVAVSPSQINLSWTAPNDGGSAITGYKIEQKDGPWSTIVANTGDATTVYSVTGLNADTTYQYRVSAINAIGTGSPSDAVSATTQSMTSTIPAQVTGLSAVAVSPSQINLSWTAPNDGGSAITGYKIEQKDGPWSTIVANTGDATTVYSVTGLNAVPHISTG